MENIAFIYDWPGECNQNGEPTQVSIPFPIYLNTSFFKEIDSIIFPFVWGYKSHRISKAHLQKSSKNGGLGLPIFKHHYWAANSRALTYWNGVDAKARENPLWLQLEAAKVNTSSLPALLFSDPAKLSKYKFTVKNSLRILKQIKAACQVSSASIYAPICQNHSFLPAQLDGAFAAGREKGIIAFTDLYINSQLASFSQLSNKFNLPSSHFFRYLQVRHYVKENWPHLDSTPTTHSFLEMLRLAPIPDS